MTDTIAAIATALSPSGIGIVRISGPESREIAGKVYRSKGGKKKLQAVPSHSLHYGFIYDGDEVIAEVRVRVVDGSRGKPGEEYGERDCQGGEQGG